MGMDERLVDFFNYIHMSQEVNTQQNTQHVELTIMTTIR